MSNKIFLGNLSWGVTNDRLTRFLRDEGYEFCSVRVILDRETGRSRGFAFVEFDTPEATIEAMVGLEGAVLEGRPLHACEAVDKSRGDRNRNGNHGGGGDRGRDSEDRFRGSEDRGGWRNERHVARLGRSLLSTRLGGIRYIVSVFPKT